MYDFGCVDGLAVMKTNVAALALDWTCTEKPVATAKILK
jgi:hypothetical protein